MSKTSLSDNIACALHSKQVGEPLAGSATEAAVWLLLSYGRPWAAKATTAGENELPADVQAWLDDMLATIPGSRLQFIRRPRMGRDVHFFVGDAQPDQQRLYRFRLHNYQQLVDLDLPALLAGDAVQHTQPQRVDEPLFLVCTNGRRDPCCAWKGAAFYRALAAEAKEHVWQTTHLGGHRFAPTVLSLPTGALYGRLSPEDAAAFARREELGELSLPYLRGRTAYAPEVQAADIFLRQETGNMQQNAYRPGAINHLKDDEVRVTFAETANGKEHIVWLQRTLFTPPLYASCDKPQLKPVYQYKLRSVSKPV